MWLFVGKECLLVKKKSFAGNLEDSLLVSEKVKIQWKITGCCCSTGVILCGRCRMLTSEAMNQGRPAS